MRTTFALLSVLAMAGCGGSSQAPDADPNAPDADPNAADADPNAPDASIGPDGAPPDGPPGATALDVELCEAINAYRQDHNLDPIPMLAGMMQVARLHVLDSGENPPQGPCNLHSWSEGDPRWSGCCYTPDHAEAACMWAKPGEIFSYSSNGYEISAAGTNSPTGAVQLWDGSSGHRNVILNLDIWANQTWRALGCAIEGGYAHVWFGSAAQ